MKKFIVTTSIYPPSEATLKFVQMKDWKMIVVGDIKTPHAQYKNIDVIYLDPKFQEERYKKLSDTIGWNCVMRRNLGFVFAYELGADIVASIDDDNIPYHNWGEKILVGKDVEVDCYSNSSGVFDILQATNHKELWHRGYPLEYAKTSSTILHQDKKKMTVHLQADLWDGDPDIDAVCRKLYNPHDLTLNLETFVTSSDYAPFNSQNTFISREALPYYMVLPGVGRMDDIWGGYICQYLLNTRPVFGPATVTQDRNIQSIKKNLEDEVLGYTTTAAMLKDMDNWRDYLPKQTIEAYSAYRNCYGLPSV